MIVILALVALSACSLGAAASVSSLAETLTPYAMLTANTTVHDDFLGTIEVCKVCNRVCR